MEPSTIVITGATRGIGLELVRQLALKHHVIMTGRSLETLEALHKDLEGDVSLFKLDVTNQSDMFELSEYLRSRSIKIHALINNAGANLEGTRMTPDPKNPMDTDIETVKASMDVNFFGAYALTRTLLPFFDRSERCDIINVSSGMGSFTDLGAGTPGYRISKAALNMFTVWLQKELEGTSIYVNAVCPGFMETVLGGVDTKLNPIEGTKTIMWILRDAPDLRGKFLRDCHIVPF